MRIRSNRSTGVLFGFFGRSPYVLGGVVVRIFGWFDFLWWRGSCKSWI